MEPQKPPARPGSIPGIGELLLPFTRNELMLLLVAFNLIAVGGETVLAHKISGGIKPAEAIPAVLGPSCGGVLLLALYLRRRRFHPTSDTLIIIGVSSVSIAVGLLGSAFHWQRALAPGGVLRWDWIIHAPPIAGPLAFVGIGLMGIIAALEDTTPETGRLSLPGVFTFSTPLTQTRQLLWLVALGLFGATLSSFLDHGRTGFENIFTMIPTVFGVFGGVVTMLLAIYHRRYASDYFIFFWTMLAMVIVGVMGVGLHINADLPEGGRGGVSVERFIRGAPLLAPMLFANMGLLGIIAIVGAEVDEEEDEDAGETD